jgi:DnaK suppressor protein
MVTSSVNSGPNSSNFMGKVHPDFAKAEISAISSLLIFGGNMTTQTDSSTQKIVPYEPKKGEAYMSPPQLNHFREILENWKNQLMADVDQTVNHLKAEASAFADPVDSASREEEFAVELRTRDRERRLIKKIEMSVDSIEQGHYGYCERCGAEIGIRRLEVRPTATQCIDCKTFSEIQEKQTGVF